MLTNFSKAGAETANSKLEICAGGLTLRMPGEVPRWRAPVPSGASLTLQHPHGGRGQAGLWLSRRLPKSVVVILKRPLFLEMR